LFSELHSHALASFAAVVLGGAAPAAPPAETADWPRGQIVERVACRDDPSESYALYLPSAYAADRRWPIVYALDPRSRALVPAELLREGAERYGFVVASSYSSRSDEEVDPNPKALGAMWRDTHARLSLDERRAYAAGFSGTVRSACRMADAAPGSLAGVIACGAGFAPGTPPHAGLPFGVFAIVGDADFNYQEVQELGETLEGLGVPSRVEAFAGPHQWPPARLLADALAWFEVRGMQDGSRPRDPALAAALLAEGQAEAAALEAGGRACEARRRYADVARDLEGLADVSSARAAAQRLRASPEHERDRRARLKWREREADFVKAAPPALSRLRVEAASTSVQEALGELHVAELRRKAERSDDPQERAAARRSLEQLYVQVAFYLPRRLRSEGDPGKAALLLAIATEVHPERADAWYDLACARAQAGWKKDALKALERAVTAGFRDAASLQSDTDLAPLHGEAGYQSLVARLSATGKS
jgi:hypothetical protein